MNKPDVNDIVTRIVNALDNGGKTLALHEPCFEHNEWQSVKDCIDSGWVSSAGEYVNRLEKMLADYTGAKHAVAVVNGTSALHTCLMLANIQPGEEILVPTLTFVATVNAIRYCNATPHFVEAANDTLGINVDKLDDYLHAHCVVKNGQCINLQTGCVIRAVIAVHIFGHPLDLDALCALCSEYHLTLIEDAAESLGSFYKDKHTGTFGFAGALSFNGNKIITGGGGGAILTNDTTLAKRAKHITTTAKLDHPWAFEHNEVAYNYRMPNLNAALLCAQLEQLELFVQQKRALACAYLELFNGATGAFILNQPRHARSNCWLNALLLEKADIDTRNAILNRLHQLNIQARPLWNLMHTLPMFKHFPHMDVSIAEDLWQRVICLPSSAFITLKQSQSLNTTQSQHATR